MKQILLVLSLVSLHHCREINLQQKPVKDEKITFVQIKPALRTELIEDNEGRSSRVESVPGSPVYSLTIDTAANQRYRRSGDDLEEKTDYEDRNNESEDRFDTSEAVLSQQEGEEDRETEEQERGVPNKIGLPQESDLFKPGFYNQNGISSLIKPKFSSTKKYYGNLEILNPNYRKYLETRQFRSRCRCERISNCPKLQVSVPRCPEEYFMCCF